MKATWLNKKNGNQCIILFFNGWGMDEVVVEHLAFDECDVLMLNEYRSLLLPLGLMDILQGYKNVHVVAWSFGVWVANWLMVYEPILVNTSLAINGTLNPVNEHFGIAPGIAQGTCEGLNPANWIKFNRRVFGRDTGQNLLSADEIQMKQDELRFLMRCFQTLGPMPNRFDRALISSDDRIMPAANQQRFWSDEATIVPADGPHALFDPFTSWSSLSSVCINTVANECTVD